MLESFLEGVRRHQLRNGLTLLTREEKRSGVVAILTWVKAGYFHESDEVAGMAHLFEHMFFKGSKNFPGSEEIAQHVSSLGGITNAGTIYDSTSYYFVVPREGFLSGVRIQADAIANPLFDPEELRKECEVVIEESNRKFDNAAAVSTERMFATAFTQHRMRRWRIGSNDVLRNIRRDNLIAFFNTLYRPENIIVAIVGDVSHEEARSAVEEAFGPLPIGELRKEFGPQEPPQKEFRFDESRADIRQSWSVFGWHTPGINHPDEQALEVVAALLGSGKYSRLYRTVVGPGGASAVAATNSTFEDVGIFTVRVAHEDANLEEVERRVFSAIERLKRFGPTEYELALTRNKLEAGFVFGLEEVLGQAQTLAFFESRGGYHRIGEQLDLIQKITVRDVQRVAREYLNTNNLTVYHYRPNGAPPTGLEDVRARIEGAAAGDHVSELDLPLPAVRDDAREALAAGSLQRFVLSNGVTLFVQPRPGTPTVSASVFFKGGRVHESSRNAGITQLMARAMRRGTTSRDHETINREIEFLGTQLGLVVEEDYFGFTFDAVQKYVGSALAILSDVLTNPTFEEDGVDEERELQIASIRRAMDSSSERPFQLFNEAFYGSHPYALPSAGYESSLGTIDASALRAWCGEEVVADGALAVVVGDIEPEDVRILFERELGNLRKSTTLRPAIPEFRPIATVRELIEVRERKQSAIVVGFPAVSPQHDDWTHLRLLGAVTSGLAGTLFAELRGRRSLAYTVYAGEASRELAGAFVGYIASDAGKEQAAKEGLIAELRRLSVDGFGEEEVARARSYIAGTTKIRLQTNNSMAAEIAENYLYSLGIDFTDRFLERISASTVEDLRRVAGRYLNADNYVVATLRGRNG
jgi:zinc protease